MVDSFLERSLEMGDTFGTTPEPHFLAEIIPSFPADSTLATRNSNLERNSITKNEAIDLGPNSYHHTGRFMPKGQRRASTEISIGELLIVAHI